ncbi:MAG: DPP IV N-terminal domain-containing protein, partial [Candidatus Binatia bacterium]
MAVAAASVRVVSAQESDPSKLDLEGIFVKAEFNPKSLGGFRWLKSGNSYAKLEPSPTVTGAMDLVGYDAATNVRSILIPADKLIPAGATTPLSIQGYDWSADNSRVLIYTNSKKVWRFNTRGDYWVLDAASGKLTKLGGNAEPSTLMFAKFSPDGKRVGYVRENNIYVEDLADGKITALTSNGSHTLINGTSDWVNEEELSLRDCWRWSPDSRSIAYWQFDAEGIKDYLLINDTNDIYPTITKIPYPKVGTINSAVHIGVVSAEGGETKWLNIPGNARDNYVPLMEWATNSDEIFLEHLNRLQNKAELMLADAKTGNVRTILLQTDDAWVDVRTVSIRWLDGGKRFLWNTEGDGWDHVYSISRDGTDIKKVTAGNFDVVSIAAVDEKGGWLYYIASPDNAAQRYLFRTRLDGSAAPERVTPETQKGWNSYDISPNGRWAIHTNSSFGNVPKYELVDVSSKSVVRPMLDNAGLQAKIDRLQHGPQEFFK